MNAPWSKTQRNKWLGQPATAQNVVPGNAGLAIALGQQLHLHQAAAQNCSGGAAGVALVGLLDDSAWEAGQYTAAGTVYTDDTVDAQDAGSDDFALHTTTNNDGSYIGCDVPFGAVSLDVTTASVGAGQVHVYEYWNGSAWVAIAAVGMLIDGPRTAGQVWAAGEQVVLFKPPTDWAKGGGPNANRYYLRIRATTAPTTAGLCRRLYVGLVYVGNDAIASNGILTRDYGDNGVPIPTQVRALHMVCATVDEGNNVELVWR